MTDPTTTRERTYRPAGVLALVAAGVGVGFVGGPMRDGLARPWDDAPRPAVRFAPPQRLEPTDTVARAAPFDYLTPNRDAATPPKVTTPPASNTMPTDWGVGTQSNVPPTAAGKPTAPAPSGSVFKDAKTWMAAQVKGLKETVTGPADQPPAPRVGQAPAPKPQPLAPAPAPLTGVSPTGVPTVAGAPAYRWWGWGATTPGMNPYAPTGAYPQGSAGWYAQSGATPGAFPVPAANPFRPEPGPTAPAYAAQPFRGPALNQIESHPTKPTLRPIAKSSMPVAGPAAMPPGSDIRWSPAMTPAPPPAGLLPPPASFDPGWNPSSTPVPPPVIRGQQPSDDTEIGSAVRAACDGLVTDVTVRQTASGKLTVGFTATTPTLAEMAARAVSATPQLRPYAVDFQAKLLSR